MKEYKISSFDLKLALLQYFRHRGWVCVDEFRGADVLIDTGENIIEIEIKITKHDLINGEKKKRGKHAAYKTGRSFRLLHPNKFLFCVPEKLVDVTWKWSNEINERYGIIGFDTEKFEKIIKMNDAIYWMQNNYFLSVAKPAERLHDNYNEKLHWAIAKRTSAKIAALMLNIFKRRRKIS